MLQSFTRRPKRVLALVGTVSATVVLALAVVAPPVAVGQATRTWVSGVGDDVNPCSRTAPCKTFAGAISKTATAGEINCLDPGGFGAVTIGKSITIECHYTEGGILAAGVNGVIINAPADAVVTLRGLDIEGQGTGLNGISFLSGASLVVDDTVIRGFRSAGGNGIKFAPTVAAELFVSDTLITDNGAPSNGAGIFIKPTATGSMKGTLEGVNLVNNNIGLQIDGTTQQFPTNLSVLDSDLSGNSFHGVSVVTNANSAFVMMDSCSASYNIGGSGLLANGAGARIQVGRSTITGNGTGTNPIGGGTIQSYQTNQIFGNTNDGTRTNINEN